MTQRKPRKPRAVKQGPRNDNRRLFSLDDATLKTLDQLKARTGKSHSAIVREAVANLSLGYELYDEYNIEDEL